MRLLTGIALEPAKGVTVRRGIDGNDVFIRNGGQVILVPSEMLDDLRRELDAIEDPAEPANDEHARTCLCRECDPHGLEVPRDRQPLSYPGKVVMGPVIRNKRGPVSPRTIDPDCWLLDRRGRWRKVVQRVKGSDEVLVTFDDGETAIYTYASTVTLATDVTEVAECEGSELPASSGAWDVVG